MSGFNKEDIAFLKELQHELNTQENDGNADPVFWGVAVDKREYGVDRRYCSDGCSIHSSEYDVDYDDDELDTLKDYLVENNYCTEDEIKDMNDLEEICDFLTDEKSLNDFEIGYYRNMKDVISPETGCFLTKRAAKHHIKINGHNLHNNPHTYAMTAFRNPEFAQLLDILKRVDWSEFEKEVESCKD